MEMKNIEVSVVTTVRNGEKHLLEMLQSVRNQSFVSFEHIVVDDGSTDRTLEILEVFKTNYPQYNLIIVSTKGIGRGEALNLAVSKAISDLIAIIDADDIWHPLKLETQFRFLNNSDSAVLATDTILFEEPHEIKFEKINEIESVSYSLSNLLRTNSVSHSSVLLKKEICRYDSERKSQFDYELWLRLLLNGEKIEKIKVPLSFHRIHENQSFESKMKKLYRWRAYKLKIDYAFKGNNLMSIFYSTGKLCFDMILPRRIRFMLRGIFIKEQS